MGTCGGGGLPGSSVVKKKATTILRKVLALTERGVGVALKSNERGGGKASGNH